MEQQQALKDLEGTLSLIGDHAAALAGKLEGLFFRAQRIAHASKEGGSSGDTMFSYDLKNFRQELRSFSLEVEGISVRLGTLARTAVYEEGALSRAQAVMRLAERLHRAVSSFQEQAFLAHQHIRRTEHKMDAWYLVQESEELSARSQAMPGTANKLLIAVSTPSEAAP